MDEKRWQEVKFSLEVDPRFEVTDPFICEYHKMGESFCLQETKKDKNTNNQVIITEEVKIETDYPCFVVSSLDKKIPTLPFFQQ